MSVGVFDPFPSEQEFVEFGRPRSGDDFSEPVDFGEAADFDGAADLSEVMDVGGVGDFGEPTDFGGAADFGEVMVWPELPAEGWVGDALAQIPLLSASDGELLDAATMWDRILSWAAGNQARVVAEFASRRRYGRNGGELSADDLAEIGRVGGVIDSMVDISAAEELSVALRVAPVTARRKMAFAIDLAGRLPAALGRMCAGELSWSKAKTLADQAENLTTKQCATLQERVLDWSVGRTPGQFRDRIRREIAKIDADALRRRAAKAVRERKVSLIPERDGMGILSFKLPGADAVAAYNWLDEIARGMKASGDERTLDQLRADAFVDLVCGRSTAVAKKPLIRALVPLETLAGGDAPGEMAGYGLIDADLARQLAADGTWQRIITDPTTGAVKNVDPKRYTPPAALRDYVETRDRTCRFPTCRQPAHRCDVDHTIRFHNGTEPGTEGNPGTVPENLAALCRRHHRIKDDPGSKWQFVQTGDGQFIWTTPTGKTININPDPPITPTPPIQDRMETADDEPPPF